MTCDDYLHQLKAVLSGDLPLSNIRSRSVRAHVGECPRCAREEEGVKALLEVIGGADLVPENAFKTERQRFRVASGCPGRSVVRFDSLSTPIGRVFVAVSDRGVCDVTLGEQYEEGYRQCLARRVPKVFRDREATEHAVAELKGYFSGTCTRFTVPVDLCAVTPFTARVLQMIRHIPFGSLRSYGEVARRIGAPQASRAVGGALSRNPVPIVVPCHRVVAHDGRLSGFIGGIGAKHALLRLEGHMTGRWIRGAD